MESEKTKEIPDLEDDFGCEDCPIKKRWPPLSMSKEEKEAMEKPCIRSWGPYGFDFIT